MKLSELREKLIAEGCNENTFSIMSQGNDAYCINKKDNEWIIFYSERGVDSEPIFRSSSEDEACEFFFNHILKQVQWHLVGFFEHEAEAQELENKLTAIGINPIRNDIPAFSSANDPCYRVFVVGKDIFKAKQLIDIGTISDS